MMRSFVYVARDKESQRQTGVVDSTDIRSAAAALTACGLIPISIEVASERTHRLSTLFDRLFYSRLLFLTTFASSFRRLLESGLTVPQSVSILAHQYRRRHFHHCLDRLLKGLISGRSLWGSMAQSPRLFPEYLVALCRAGEDSGCLAEVLGRASDFFERLRKLRNRITTSLVYPSFLALLLAVTVLLLFSFILPRITFIYEQLNADLPWQTKALLGVGQFLQSWWVVLMGALGVTVLVFLSAGSGKWTGRRISAIRYRVPFLGRLLARAELADQLAVVGLLLRHGVSLPAALRVATSLSGHRKQIREFKEIARNVEAGRSLAWALSFSGIIPEYARDIIALGEEADCLSDGLENSSAILKADVERRLIVVTTLFEPLMVLGIAVLIGFVVFSILLPILSVDFVG